MRHSERCATSDAAHTERLTLPHLTLSYPSAQGVLARLRELPVDTAALQTCSIGRTMNRLKKAGPAALREPAARLVAEWKRVVDEEGAAAGGGHAGGAGGPRVGAPSGGGGGGDAKRDRSSHCAVFVPAPRCTEGPGSMRPAECGLSQQQSALPIRRCLHSHMRSLDGLLVGPQTPRVCQVCESGAHGCVAPPLTTLVCELFTLQKLDQCAPQLHCPLCLCPPYHEVPLANNAHSSWTAAAAWVKAYLVSPAQACKQAAGAHSDEPVIRSPTEACALEYRKFACWALLTALGWRRDASSSARAAPPAKRPRKDENTAVAPNQVSARWRP